MTEQIGHRWEVKFKNVLTSPITDVLTTISSALLGEDGWLRELVYDKDQKSVRLTTKNNYVFVSSPEMIHLRNVAEEETSNKITPIQDGIDSNVIFKQIVEQNTAVFRQRSPEKQFSDLYHILAATRILQEEDG